jgi:hypothetical protein
MFPVTETFGATTRACRFKAGGTLEEAPGGPAHAVSPTHGSWTLESFDPRWGGRVAGSISLSFESDAGNVTLEGPYDLRIVRVPVENDWPGP